MNSSYPAYTPPAPAPAKPGRSWGMLIAAIVTALVIVGGIAGFFLLDPLQLNVGGMLRVLLGLGGDPTAAAMPADSIMFVGVDLLNATPEKINRIYKPFKEAGGTPQANNDATSELDTSLQKELGLTVKDDITPWMGRYAGLSILDISVNAKTREPKVELVLAVQSRDNAKADEFLVKLKAALEKKNKVTLKETQLSGVKVYSMDPPVPTGSLQTNGMAFARSGDVVLISLTPSAIESAIKAQKEQSLANDKAYTELVNQLPTDRIMTFYLSSKDLKDFYTTAMQMSGTYAALPPEALDQSFDTFTGMAYSLNVVDAGLQIDGAVAYALDKLPAGQKEMLAKVGEPVKSIDMLPEDALFFFGGTMPKEAWTAIRSQVTQSGGVSDSEYNEAMKSFEKQFNVNPDTGIFPYLGGDILLAGFPSKQGLLAASGAPLGLALLVETNDPQKMFTSVDTMITVLKKEPGVTIARKDSGDLKYFSLTDNSSKKEAAALGVGKSYLAASTSSADLEKLFAGKTSLGSSSRYQSAVKSLPGGIAPAFYIDLEKTLAEIRGGLPKASQTSFDNSVKSVKPLTSIVAGTSRISGNIARFSAVLAVTPAK